MARKYKPSVVIPHVARGVVRVDWDGFCWHPWTSGGTGVLTIGPDTFSITWSAKEAADVLGVR